VLAVIPEPVDPGTNGLVAYYALENNTDDSSGNDLHGTIVGAPSYVEGPAGYGTAMEFDGESYVDCSFDPRLDITGPISMGIWIRPGTDGSVETAPLSKADAVRGWSWQLRYGWNTDKPTIMGFQFNGTDDRVWIYVNQELAVGEWYYIAASHDGATVKCYLDGLETDSAPMSSIVGGPSSLLIGSDGWRDDWIGAIDEVAIYDRALSDSEILYLAGMRMPIDPVHSYTFEDGTGNDSIGQADGVLMGDATIVDGSLTVDGAGDWMEMPGDVIAINTYSAMTLELWSTQSVDNPFSMTASFGGTWDNGMGKDYIFIATGRGDQMNRGSIANTPDQVNPWEDEVGVSSPELNDGMEHHYVLTITAAELAYYVDGVLIGTVPMGDTTISGVSNDFVYLGKGIYSVDATMNCSINEFNIYDVALSEKQIAASYAAGPVK